MMHSLCIYTCEFDLMKFVFHLQTISHRQTDGHYKVSPTMIYSSYSSCSNFKRTHSIHVGGAHEMLEVILFVSCCN